MVKWYVLWEGMCVLKKEGMRGVYGVLGVNVVGEGDIYGMGRDWIG